jgi:homoserine O-acetyltransferase
MVTQVHVSAALAAFAGISVVLAAQTPPAGQDVHRRLYSLRDFRLESGVVLPNATLAYATFGSLNARRDNAILVPSWYGADHHGYDFLIGAGRALDPAKHFIVATEMFANGFSSSPSNTPPPFDRARFPAIEIRDNVAAVYQLLTRELHIDHLVAIVGFSMGAQQAFQWAVGHPDFVDLIAPYCGTAKTYPHGVVRLESAIAALTADAAFNGGDYASPPIKGLTAWAHHWSAWVTSQEWWRRELFKPEFSTPGAVLQAEVERQMARDPNNMIAQARTWQRHNIGDTPGFGGDHEKALRSIRARVLYMPSQTDLYFPLADAEYERAFIPRVTWDPIPTLWGHRAGAGRNAADTEFLNTRIARALGR